MKYLGIAKFRSFALIASIIAIAVFCVIQQNAALVDKVSANETTEKNASEDGFAPSACSLSGTLGTAPAGGTTGGLSMRLQRNGTPAASTCSSAPYPGLFSVAGSYAFNTHTITNTSATAACMTFTLITTSTSSDLQIAAFKAPFTAVDISNSAKYLGDPGMSSVGTTILTFQTIVPGNTNIDLVVFSPTAGSGLGTPYSLSVTSTNASSTCGLGIGNRSLPPEIVSVAIPDNTPSGIDISIPVSGIGRIRDLNFSFDAGAACNATIGNTNAAVDHSIVGELVFKLTSPKGTSVTFMNRRGGLRDNICSTFLDDEFASPLLSSITNVNGASVSGNFQTERLGRFANFKGENADGIWILNVSDNQPFDTGNLRRVTLNFTDALFPKNDFENDRKADIAIFRPSVGEWYYQRTGSGIVSGAQFGSATDKPVAGDYTGDGRTDLAFFRPSTGTWFILRSEDSSFYAFPFGDTTDIPAPGDFDGDGLMDAAVFRPLTGIWYINKSTGGVTSQPFGANGDIPVAENYDGDNKTDIAIYRPSNGEWYTLRSIDSQVRGATFGGAGDKPVQGDYTGDGKADFAFWRPSTGSWFVLRSEDSSFFASPFGISTDKPTPGDYDGDGKIDQAVFRPSNSTWYINQSTAGVLIRTFGLNTDVPIPGLINQ